MIYNTMYVARDSEAIYTPHLAILIDSLITAERPERGSCEHSLPSSVEAGEFTVDHFKCSRLVHHLPLRADKLAVVKTTLKSSSGEYHVQASRTSCFFFWFQAPNRATMAEILAAIGRPLMEEAVGRINFTVCVQHK